MYVQLGLPDEAAKQQRERIEVARRAYGRSDPRFAEDLLSYAEAILDSPQRAQTLAVLDEARRVLDSAGDFASETRGRLLTLYAQANSYTSIGDMRRYADDAVAFFRKHYPDTSGYVIAVVSGIRGASLLAEGALEEAERLIAVDVADARQHYPDSSPLAWALRVQASLYTALGRYDEADKLLVEAADIWRRIARAADPATSNRYVLERARVAIARGDPATALELLGGIVPPRHVARLPLPLDAIAANLLTADAKLRQHRFEEAAQSAQDVLQAVQASPMRAYYGSLEAEAALRLGVAQHHTRDFSNARTNLDRAVRLREALDVPTSPWLAEAQLALAACLMDLNQRSTAAALEAIAKAILASHPQLGQHFTRVAALSAPPGH